MFSMVEKKDGTPVIITGPTWPTCMCCTVPIIIIGSFLVTWFILMDVETNMPWWILPIYISFIVGSLVSLFFTSCCDPGILECVADKDIEKGWILNEYISSFRPPNATYCKECKVLIEEYEHECPWTGIAIGKGNAMAFHIFLLFVNSLCYFSIGLILYYSFVGYGYAIID